MWHDADIEPTARGQLLSPLEPGAPWRFLVPSCPACRRMHVYPIVNPHFLGTVEADCICSALPREYRLVIDRPYEVAQ